MRTLRFPLGLSLCVLLGCSSASVVDRVTQSDSNAEIAEPLPPPKPLASGLKRLIEKGYHRYRHSDFAGAIQQWEPVWTAIGRSEDKWTPSLLYYCYMATGQYKKALTIGEENLKGDPHQPLGYQQVGMAQLWLGKNNEAEDFLRRAAEFDARSADVYFYLGLALQRRGKKGDADREFDRGEAEYKKILQQNPADFQANYGLAYSYLYREKDPESAAKLISAARESLRVNPDVELTPDKNLYQGFYLPLLEGITLSRQKRAQEAVEILITAMQNSPSGARADLAEVYHFLARSLKDLGEAKPSKDFLAKSLELDPYGPYAKTKLP